MCRCILFVLLLVASPALSAPSRGGPPDAACREEHARCRDGCALDFGASISHRPRLATCLQRCDRAEEVCREKGLRASKKEDAPSRPRSDPALGTSRDEPVRSTVDAPSPALPAAEARNVGAPEWLDAPDEPLPSRATPLPVANPRPSAHEVTERAPVLDDQRPTPDPVFDDQRPMRDALPDPLDELDPVTPDPAPKPPVRQATPAPASRAKTPSPADELDFSGDDLFFADEPPASGAAPKPATSPTAPRPASPTPARATPPTPARAAPTKSTPKPLVEVPEDHSEWNPD